jgi:hypothetical protein
MPIIQPRFIRGRDAPAYLGMCKSVFAAEVRPHLVEIPIGSRGIAFDRLDLDAWADEYKARNGRPMKGGDSTWEAQERRVAPAKSTVIGSSTKPDKGKESLPGSNKPRKKGRNGDSPPKSPAAKQTHGKRPSIDDVIAMCSQIAEGCTKSKRS